MPIRRSVATSTREQARCHAHVGARGHDRWIFSADGFAMLLSPAALASKPAAPRVTTACLRPRVKIAR